METLELNFGGGRSRFWHGFRRWMCPVVVGLMLSSVVVKGAGTWVPLNNSAPDIIDTMLLLPDGTGMATGGSSGPNGVGNAWYRLTPDTNGRYVNGTWTTLAPMHDTRLYYSSQVLRDGRVLVAGGEYGTGGNAAEVYDPQSNTWMETPPTGQHTLADSISEILPNGDVLISPV